MQYLQELAVTVAVAVTVLCREVKSKPHNALLSGQFRVPFTYSTKGK